MKNIKSRQTIMTYFYPKAIILALFISLGFHSTSYAQDDDLMSILDDEEEETVDYASATFKGTRIINCQSIETPAGGVLQFMIAHRFGRLNGGAYELFGIDNATMRMGFAYGITDRLTVGIGRSSFEKTYDGYLKFKVLRQSKGAKKMPVSVTAFASTAIKTLRFSEPDRDNLFSSRLYYTYQLLIARKFTKNLSIQLSPSLVHRNLVLTKDDKNDVFVLGAGGRYKLGGSVSINVEYFWIPEGQIVSPLYGEEVNNKLSLGVDIETGGHVFQFHITNSRGMAEKNFMTETTGKWLDGDIHFGFNISRVFTLDRRNRKPKMKKEKKD